MQEFFKKQRLQSTLEARNNPQWPEVRGSKDLQRLDMYSRRIAPTPTALDNKASNLACSEYLQDGNSEDPCPTMEEANQEPRSQGSYYNPDWLQVSCEESQGTITIPQYGSDDDGLIAGVDFPEDNPPGTPLLYRQNHANVLRNGQPIAMDPMFPWPANVEPNEEPMPISPVGEPKTPSVRWASKQQPQAQRTWSLRSSDIASCSSLTPATTVSYRDSPSDSCLSAMVQNYLHDAAANKREPLSLRLTAARGHSTVRLGRQPRPDIQDTPSSHASPLSIHRFIQETPANRRTGILQHDRPQHETRTPQQALQQKRKVASYSNSASSSLEVDQGTTTKRRETINLQQSDTLDARSLQSGHQTSRDVPSTPYGSSLSRNFQQDVAKRAEEQPGVPQTTAQDSRGSHHGLKCQRDVQATPKIRTTPVATRDQPDLAKSRAECTRLQHAAEHGTRTPMSSLHQREPVSAVHTPATNPQRRTVPAPSPTSTSRPQPSLQEQDRTQNEPHNNSLHDNSQKMTGKSTEMTAVHPSVMELRDMDSFYKSAWVLQLQRAHHQLYIEEIKAQVLYEPPDRFSIMSAFEDVDDHFAGHKSRRSSLRYRTLDDELQVLSPGDLPASQGVMKDARTVPGAQGRLRHRRDQHGVSSEKSGVRKIPSVETAGHADSSPSMHRCEDAPEHFGHSTSDAETVPDTRLCSPRGADKVQLEHQAFSQESDKQCSSSCPVSKSGSQKWVVVRKEEGTMTSPNAYLMTTSSGDIAQQAHATGLKTEDSTMPCMHRCSCSVPKADKTCQIQPEVANAATWCDEKIVLDQLQAGDHGSVHISADSEKL